MYNYIFLINWYKISLSSYLVNKRYSEIFSPFLNILLLSSRWSFLLRLQNLLKIMQLLECMMLRLVCFFWDLSLIWSLLLTRRGFIRCCLLPTCDVYPFLAVSSRQSRSLAEDAFFHPSIMSISYYSFEHCFAIYSVRPLTLLSAINTRNIFLLILMDNMIFWWFLHIDQIILYILIFIIIECRSYAYIFHENVIPIYWQDFFSYKRNEYYYYEVLMNW